jgi:hypothetical protein
MVIKDALVPSCKLAIAPIAVDNSRAIPSSFVSDEHKGRLYTVNSDRSVLHGYRSDGYTLEKAPTGLIIDIYT